MCFDRPAAYFERPAAYFERGKCSPLREGLNAPTQRKCCLDDADFQ
jgi:hypothetical protein